MAAAEQEQSLENWLNRATNPVNREEDWEFIMGFCDQINQELEGPQIACPLIAHKIQSPQEREALLALSTLEACVKNCGRRFHQEIGKFRFLNEIIKVISPKYFGSRTSERVKKKCIELLYSWSKGLEHETKIKEAYTMLKSQGVIVQDPVHMDNTLEVQSPARAKNAIFEDDEKSKLLARLLKSRSPEDLQSANRLIKNMVKEDNDRMDRVSRRINELEKMKNNMKLLSEMIAHYNEESSSQADKDMMKELFETLEKNRPILFKLASETDEKDNDGINDILKTNDEMMKVMNVYKNIVQNLGDNADATKASLLDLDFKPPQKTAPPPGSETSGESTADLLQQQLSALGLDDTAPPPSVPMSSIPSSIPTVGGLTNIFSGFPQYPAQGVGASQTYNAQVPTNQTVTPSQFQPFQQSMFSSVNTPPQSSSTFAALFANSGLPAGPGGTPASLSSQPTPVAPSVSAMDDLKVLGTDWLSQSKPTTITGINTGSTLASAIQSTPPQGLLAPIQPTTQPTTLPATQSRPQQPPQPAMPLAQPYLPTTPPIKASIASQPLVQPIPDVPKLTPPVSSPVVPPVVPSTATPNTPAMFPGQPTSPQSATPVALSLADVFVALESIKPGDVEPLQAYEKNGMKILIHFAKDSPRADVSVMVVSVMSSNPTPVTGFTFQAAVPKVMKVKLQPPSATDLPSYNPILPPSAITQVMLVANPLNERVRLKFKLKYTIDDKEVTDFGEVDSFPTSKA